MSAAIRVQGVINEHGTLELQAVVDTGQIYRSTHRVVPIGLSEQSLIIQGVKETQRMLDRVLRDMEIES